MLLPDYSLLFVIENMQSEVTQPSIVADLDFYNGGLQIHGYGFDNANEQLWSIKIF